MRYMKWPAAREAIPGLIGIVLCLNLAVTGVLWMQRGETPELTAVVRQTQSAVVSILREDGEPPASTSGPLPAGEASDGFAGRGARDGDQPEGQTSPSLGAGVLVDPDGLIVTNFHVISDLEVIRVRLHDDRVFDAEVVGADPRTDIALLSIDAGAPLPWIALADSDNVNPGEVVLAIGDPLGYEGSVTMGIVSGSRRAYDDVDPVDFIQHDAAINPGNSGGPIVNLAGQLVGLNTAIPDTSPFDIGIGLAIPSNLLRAIAAQLEEHGEVRRAWLGLHVEQLDRSLAEALGRLPHSGLVVTGVVDGSPAAASGVQVGDIVTTVDGTAIRLVRDLARALEGAAVSSSLEVVVVRNNNMRVIRLTTAVAPAEADENAPAAQAAASDATEAAGEDDDDTVAHAAAIDRRIPLGFLLAGETRTRGPAANGDDADEGPGVVIGEVDPDGLARRAGLTPGDRILAIGASPVEDYEEAVRLLGQAQGPTLALLVQRQDGLPTFIILPRQQSAEDRVPLGNIGGLSSGPY
jgi:serine protease Do